MLGAHVQAAAALRIQLTQTMQAIFTAVTIVHRLALAALREQALGDNRTADHLVAAIVGGGGQASETDHN